MLYNPSTIKILFEVIIKGEILMMSIFDGEMLLQRMKTLIEWSNEFEGKLDGMDRGNFKEVMKYYKSQKEALEIKISVAKHDTKIDF